MLKKDIWSDLDELVFKSDEQFIQWRISQSHAWKRIVSDSYKVMLHGSANDEIMWL